MANTTKTARKGQRKEVSEKTYFEVEWKWDREWINLGKEFKSIDSIERHLRRCEEREVRIIEHTVKVYR